jgi:hypothetical protein
MANLTPEEKKTEYITKKKTKRKMGPASGLRKKDNEIQLITDDKIIELTTPKNMKSGGRVNLRGGGICKKGMNKKAIGANS